MEPDIIKKENAVFSISLCMIVVGALISAVSICLAEAFVAYYFQDFLIWGIVKFSDLILPLLWLGPGIMLIGILLACTLKKN